MKRGKQANEKKLDDPTPDYILQYLPQEIICSLDDKSMDIVREANRAITVSMGSEIVDNDDDLDDAEIATMK